MKRPVGVTILAVIAIIYGAFSLLVALLGVAGIAIDLSGALNRSTGYNVPTLVYAVIGDVILGVLYLIFGIGSLQLKGWAWTTGVVALALDVLRQLVGLFILQGFSVSKLVVAIITVVVAALVIWYLFRPNVRAAFGKSAQAA